MKEEQLRIIQDLGVQNETSAPVEIERRVNFLADYAQSVKGCRGFVLGISGGQDSTLAGRLAQMACEKLRTEGHSAEFVAVRLPYGEQHDADDAVLALNFIEPDTSFTVQIQPTVDALAEAVSLGSGQPLSDFNKGNIKARARMMAQYAIAGDNGLLVIGTDHAAEAITGFFTKHGDGAADVLPLTGLTKGQGREMLQELQAPARLWQKLPTADLLDDSPGQLDEVSLGVSYETVDSFLLGDTVEEEFANNLIGRYSATEHKRRLPVGVDDDWWRSK